MKFILRLGGPCCPYPLYNIQLSEGSESMIELSTNGLYKGNAVVITPKSGYRMNKLSITVNGQLIEVSENLASFIMPKKDVTITVTDLRTDLEKVLDLLTNSGYTENLKLFTQGKYIWMEGTNEGSEVKAIILADNTNYLEVSTLGNTGEEVVSQLVSSENTQDIGQYITSLRTLDSYEYYMPESVNSFIGEEIEVIEDPYNGHAYVDLGLPSGTKWATMNVGASSETGYGNYYQYGKGAAQYAETMSDSDYSGTEDPLDSSVDTATQVWGGSWYMPTRSQMQELTANTTYQWVTNYKGSGINGGTFTATNGAVLFFPAAGLWGSGSQYGVGNGGSYWGSSPSGSHDACNLYFGNGSRGVSNDGSREYGYSVRPVVG